MAVDVRWGLPFDVIKTPIIRGQLILKGNSKCIAMWHILKPSIKMKLKSLSKAELIEAIIWSRCDAMVRELEPRYDGQPRDEQTREYHELHALYCKYYDEAHRRGFVPLSSDEAQKKAVLKKNKK